MQWPFRSHIVVRANRFRVPKTARQFWVLGLGCLQSGGRFGHAWLTLMYSTDFTLK